MRATGTADDHVWLMLVRVSLSGAKCSIDIIVNGGTDDFAQWCLRQSVDDLQTSIVKSETVDERSIPMEQALRNDTLRGHQGEDDDGRPGSVLPQA
jgi:hypothetical protein